MESIIPNIRTRAAQDWEPVRFGNGNWSGAKSRRR